MVFTGQGLDHNPSPNINTLGAGRSDNSCGTTIANTKDELQNKGRAEMIRATGAVLIASALLYFPASSQATSKLRLMIAHISIKR
jgi:hypothetical protein